MANPRQRSKARSHKSTKPSLNSKRRMHQKLRRAPPLKGPEVLQKGWDKHKTVFQK
jgi:nucleolar protein 16